VGRGAAVGVSPAGFPSPRSRTRRAPFVMHRALPCRIRVVGHPHLEQVVTAHLQVGDDGDGALIDPSIPGAAREPPPVPATDHEARRLGILLAQPAPQAVPHIMIDAGEHLLGSVAVLVEASPTEQDRIEGVDDLLEGETRTPPRRELLDAVVEVLDPGLGDFDAGPVAPPVIPSQPDTMAEELKALGERGDVRLFWGERQLHLLPQKDGKTFLFGTGLFLGPVNEHHKIVGISNGQEHDAPRLALIVAELAQRIPGTGIRLAVAGDARRDVSGVPTLNARQHDVGEQWREHAALRSSGLGAHQSALGQNARFQEGPHQSCHPPVSNAPTQARHDMVVIDVVEASLDVPFNDPLIGRTGPIGFGLLPGRSDRVADMLQCIATGPFRAEAIRDGQELRLEDRLQQLQERGLNHAILHRRHTERPEQARLATLRNHHAPHRARAIAAIQQRRPRHGEEALDADARLDVLDSHFVHTRRARAAIARDTSPCKAKVLWLGNPVPHVSPRIIRSGPTPRVEFALSVEKPDLVSLINGVHRSFLLRRKTTWHLIPFAMWPALPASDYYGISAPTHRHHPASKG